MAVALPIIAVVASVAGTAYSAYSSHQAGQEAEKAEKRQAYYLGEQARVRGEQEEAKARRLLSTQRSKIGASGISTEGSPLLNMMESQAQYEKDLMNIRQGYAWEISETLAKGEAASQAGATRAGSTLLTGVANTANQVYGWYRTGGTV